MATTRFALRASLAAAGAALAALCWLAPAVAQNLNVSSGPAGGVEIDAEGVLKLKGISDNERDLALERIKNLKIQDNGKVARPSKLRKVSLTRLEKAVAQALVQGGALPAEMLNLAGLTRVQYVFFYPETKDIVIAGPAEGFADDPTGRVIGRETGRAILQLDDLVVALRAYGPGGKGAGVIGCSIDPTSEGLKALQAKVAQLAAAARRTQGRPTDAQVREATAMLQNALGLQTITVNGISPKTHMAKVLVEADYRMKLIGIGLDKPPVRITSYVSLADAASVARNALKRWYFVPDYKCVRVAEDGNAMELVGQGVKLVGADELVGSDGSRKASGSVDRASQAFCTSFTKLYPELAKRAPVYAQLRSVIDLCVAAAFIQKQDYYGKAGWTLETFGDEKKLAVEIHAAPKHAPSVCTAVWKGGRLVTPIGGGVHSEPRQALKKDNLLADEDGSLAKAQSELSLSGLADGQWWWD